jgi:hypothetical protein
MARIYLVQVVRRLEMSLADYANVFVINVVPVLGVVPSPPLPTPVVTAATDSCTPVLSQVIE